MARCLAALHACVRCGSRHVGRCVWGDRQRVGVTVAKRTQTPGNDRPISWRTRHPCHLYHPITSIQYLRTMQRPLRIIFDLDDTLYPERSFAMSGFRAAGAWAAREWGINGIAGEMACLLDDGHLGAVFKIALERHRPQHSKEDLARFIDVYRSHKPELELFGDAMQALERSKGFGPLGLITDGTDWVQKNKVRALGIADCFDTIIYTAALGGRQFHKPHPRAFEMMEAALATPDALFVYIGDNPAKDFVSPNARGWATVQVVREDGIHDAHAVVDGGAPQHTIGALVELGPLLDTLAQ